MSGSVKGVVVLARNGDRTECYQDPVTYKYGTTESTPLGEVQSHQLGTFIRNTYFNPSSRTYVPKIAYDLVNLKEVHVRVKIGSEGTSVFDSATALLQGLFPPNPKNRISLANETVVVAPLGGYQYIPVETVEPFNDLSLESWTGCPAFESHIAKFHASEEFKKKAKESQHILASFKDYIFGRPAILENIWNIHDFMLSELTHNKTYAHRLPPTYLHSARDLLNWHEDKIFSDVAMNGIGNIAGRTTMHSVLTALERISFDHDPLKFLLIETTYQPFISLFHMTEIADHYPHLKGLPDYTSALVIELFTGPAPDTRDFVRIRFKNGTEDDDLTTLNVFGHKGDIPLTEFIYRLENAVIDSPYEWSKVCNSGYRYSQMLNAPSMFGIAANEGGAEKTVFGAFEILLASIMGALFVLGLWMTATFVKRRVEARRRIQLPTACVGAVVTHEGVERIVYHPDDKRRLI